MASHEAYLRSALAKYSYADVTKREVSDILQTFTDLKPVINKYVFNDGIGKDLLCLDGTIQVTYMGRTYNIPICIWLMDTHPYNSPLVYVKPTPSMQIKTGHHVDGTGRVYLPFLHEWKHPQSDINGLLQILSMVFGDEPPVFAKPPATSSTPAQPATYTGGGAQLFRMPTSVMPVSGGPYPPTSAAIPPFHSYPSAAPVGTHPYAYPGGGVSPRYPGGYPGQAYAPYRVGGQGVYPPVTAEGQGGVGGVGLSDEEARLSLLSAVEEKMRRRLMETTAQSQAEMETMRRTREDLEGGRRKLDDMLQRLEREQNDVAHNIRMLEGKQKEMEEAIVKVESRDTVSIDEALQPTAPVYKQLLHAFAEEQATEDAIYYMGEALRKGIIDFDAFLKHVRELSRRQFTLRMLMHSCRRKAGLADISG